MKKLVASLLILVSILSLIGCSTKSFSRDGITLTLSKEFIEAELPDIKDAHVSYTSQKAKVAVFKDKHGTIAYSLREYAGQWMLANNAVVVGEVSEDGDIVTVTHKITYLGNTNIVYTAFYDNGEYFWIVQFFCLEEDYGFCSPYFAEWAKKVKFN